MSHFDIHEVKEPIKAEYKRQIFIWARKSNHFIPGVSNWEALNIEWDVLNHK